MERYKYVIVGGGMTADAAAKGIRKTDRSGEVAIFSEERHAPYNRPPLSKGLWKGKPMDQIWRHTEEANPVLRLEQRIVAIDTAQKTVTDQTGASFGYEKLLLATGGTPRKLPTANDGTIYYRTLDDYLRLREASDHASRFAVIGAGFIGSEIAAALALNGKEVTLLFPEQSIGERIYPARLSQFLNSYYRQKGVQLEPRTRVQAVERHGGAARVSLQSGRTIEADVVIAGLGIEPNVELAAAAGLPVENGIAVDEYCRTTNADVYAAGDVASFPSAALGGRRRVEHEDNANTMGRVAGRNMAGRAERYDYLPYFYSDLFDLGYEAVGETDPRLDIVEDWQEPFQKGVVYYLRFGRVRGVLLWNTWGQVDAARKLIASPQTFEKTSELKGRIAD